MGKPKHAGRDTLSYGEVKEIIDNAPALKYKAFFALLYLTGGRVSELTNRYVWKYNKKKKKSVIIGKEMGIRKSNITVTDKDVYVTLPLLKKKKSLLKDEHTLVFSKKAPFMDTILSYLSSLKEEDALFPFTRTMAWKVLRKLNDTAWLHLFRHTRLSSLARVGASPEDLRTWAGHADYRYLGRYLQMIPIKKFKDVIK